MRRLLPLLTCLAAAGAGEWPRELRAYQGSTPRVDGVISPGEYDDATHFTGVRDWIAQFTPTTDDADLSLEGWVKHDGRDLCFAFRVTDDVLYGIDTPRWVPKNNPYTHELSRRGWPWFGDEMELLINASNEWSAEDGQNSAGDGTSWQMVCNLTKSRLGGVGVGGLLEGEPRARKLAWDTYQKWILSGAMRAVARLQPRPVEYRFVGPRLVSYRNHGRGGVYVIEWMIHPNPCLEVRPGVFWSPTLGETRMGLNIALGDIDEENRAPENFAGFHHEDWWAGEKNKRTWLKQFGTLILIPGPRPQ